MIEVDFKDRIPTHAGRVRLTPVSGQPDLFTMERADEPTEQGTPLDKATFDSVTKSRLTGRYYAGIVTKKVVSFQTITTNPIPKSGWVLDTSKMKGTAGAYTVEVNSLYSSYTPEKALDGNTETEYRSNGDSVVTLTLTFPAAVKITKYKIAMRAENYTRAISTEFQGSNNGTNWTTLFTTTEKPETLKEYTLTQTGEYKQYRLQFTASETGVNVYSFEISNLEIITYKNEYTIEKGVPTKWDEGQIILFSYLSIGSSSNSHLSTSGYLIPLRIYGVKL